MWTSYKEKLKREHDFLVEYILYSFEDGGRKSTYQGYRCDFMYCDDNPSDGIYMIHPEFLDKDNEVIIDDKNPVNIVGRALMWIIVQEMKDYHKKRLKVVSEGYLMEGSRIVGEVKILELNM